MIHEVSKAIQDILGKELYPDLLMDMDNVKQCIPTHENLDFKVGIYLYDVTESNVGLQKHATIVDHLRIFPPKMMELSYLIFVNEEVQFGGYSKEQEELLLERIIRTFHDLSKFNICDEELSLQFENVSLENKIHLWQSLQKPLQPAIYLKISPVRILSNKKEEVIFVRRVDIHTKRKAGG